MPRRARLAVAGIPWHIIQRGNNRSVCFFAEEDYLFYLDQLRHQSTNFGCAVHAYCLMTNHVHLLITPQEPDGPSLMMKHLGQRFVQYINRTYTRSGTLWEGRFKSCLAQNEGYALNCYRYIEMNPVRAKIADHPRGYAWSSFHHNGDGKSSALVAPHPSYLSLGADEVERRNSYRSLMGTKISEKLLTEIRSATNGNYVLGNDGFQCEVELLLNRRVIPGVPGRPRKAD